MAQRVSLEFNAVVCSVMLLAFILICVGDSKTQRLKGRLESSKAKQNTTKLPIQALDGVASNASTVSTTAIPPTITAPPKPIEKVVDKNSIGASKTNHSLNTNVSIQPKNTSKIIVEPIINKGKTTQIPSEDDGVEDAVAAIGGGDDDVERDDEDIPAKAHGNIVQTSGPNVEDFPGSTAHIPESSFMNPLASVLVLVAVVGLAIGIFVRHNNVRLMSPRFVQLHSQEDSDSPTTQNYGRNDSEVDKLVIDVLKALGIPIFGALKFQSVFHDQHLTDIEQLSSLDDGDWRRLDLPIVIEEAIRARFMEKPSSHSRQRSHGLTLMDSSSSTAGAHQKLVPNSSSPPTQSMPSSHSPHTDADEWNFEDDGDW